MKTNSDFLHKSSSWVEIGLHAENQLPGYLGSGLNKLFRVGGVGWLRIDYNANSVQLLLQLPTGTELGN